MRKITLSALLFAGALIVTACEGPKTTDPMEVDPSFGTVDGTCLNLEEEVVVYGETWVKSALLAHIHGLIDEYFTTRNSINSAHSHIDNTARKICGGDYAAAAKMAWSFLVQVDQQLDGEPAKRVPPYVYNAAELATNTFGLIWDPGSGEDPITIPDGAFRATGGIGVLDTRKGGTIFSRNYEAAAVVGTDDYDAGDQLFLVLSRTYDPQVLIPGFNTFPEGYQILASDTPLDSGDGVLVQMCVLLTDEVVNSGIFERLQLGHDLGDGTVHLLERVTEGLSIDCTQAEDYLPDPMVVSSGWLQSLTRWAGARFERLLAPSPLFGDVIGGTGLGGRTKSFSPFAPVDIYSSLSVTIDPPESTITVGETVQLGATLHDPFDVIPADAVYGFTWGSSDPLIATVDGNGVVTGAGPGTTNITATLHAPGVLPDGVVVSGEATITVLPLLPLEVVLENQADNSKEFRVTWTPSFGDTSECIADPRTTITCRPEFPAGQEVTFTAETLWPTLPNSNVPGFDIWITPGGEGCSPHQEGSGVATCVFTMPPEASRIVFRNANGRGD